jgi:hypothetical protein
VTDWRDRWVNRYLYFRFAYGRGSTHVELVLGLASKITIFAVLLKLYEIPSIVLWILGGTVLVMTVLLGHYDIKKGVVQKEISLHNHYNREMQRLLDK